MDTPTEVKFLLTNNGKGVSTTLRVAAPQMAAGKPSYILLPDGTKKLLSRLVDDVTLTKPGVYTLVGRFTAFKIIHSDSTIDLSLSKGEDWNALMSSIPNFGSSLFTNIFLITGIPKGLALRCLDRTFEGTSVSTNLSSLNTAKVTSAVATFLNSDVAEIVRIQRWDMSNVVNLSRMFENASLFNCPIGAWDIRKAEDLSFMFKGAAVFDRNLDEWSKKLGNVTDMTGMFEGAKRFNGVVSHWDVSSVISMTRMFSGCAEFNQPLEDWDVSNVREMDSMFFNANSFKQDISGWCVNLIPNAPLSFKHNAPMLPIRTPGWGTCPCQKFNGEIYYQGGGSRLNVSGTLAVAGFIIQPDGSKISIGPGNFSQSLTQKGTYELPMETMTVLSFADNTEVEFDFSPFFYTGSLVTTRGMFEKCRAFNGNISDWDTRKVRDMTDMFKEATSFEGNISDWSVHFIKSIPDGFDEGAEFEEYDEIQPAWGDL